jgi:hypothetical protein
MVLESDASLSVFICVLCVFILAKCEGQSYLSGGFMVYTIKRADLLKIDSCPG